MPRSINASRIALAGGALVAAACTLACRPAARAVDDGGAADAASGDSAAVSALVPVSIMPSPSPAALREGGVATALVDAAVASVADGIAHVELVGLAGPHDPTGVTFPDGVGREIERLAPAFRACYAHGLARDAKQGGTSIVTVTVSQDGRVLKASLTPDGLTEDVLACVTVKLKAATFDPVIGDARTLSFQVTFTPPR